MMKYRLYCIIFYIIIFLFLLFAPEKDASARLPVARVDRRAGASVVIPEVYNIPVHGCPLFSNPVFLKRVEENTRRLYPDVYAEIENLRKAAGTRRISAVGDSTRFIAFDVPQEVYYLFSAELRAIGTRSNIWVEKGEWAQNHVTETEVRTLLAMMDENTPEASRDPGKGVIELEGEYFGTPPDIDGDDKTDVVLLDIRDGWIPGRAFIAGYFTPVDQSPTNENSNKRDIIYIDIVPGIYWPYTGSIDVESARETLGHEFQHLINYNYDKSEETWINEGLSTYAQYLTGFGLENFADYLMDTDRDLTVIKGDLELGADPEIVTEYHKVQMFMFYLWEQFGDDFIRELVQTPRHGIEGIRDALTNSGFTGDFTGILTNWALANIIGDRAVNPAYGYREPELQGIAATPQNEHFSFPVPAKTERVDPYSYEYIRFSGGDSLIVSFDAPNFIIKAVRKGEGITDVRDVDVSQPYLDYEFGSTITDILFVVINPTRTARQYAYSAAALQNTLLTEIAYDDGEPDVFSGTAHFLGWGSGSPGYGWAASFEPPAVSAVLSSARMYIFSPNRDEFEFHVWDASGFLGRPGRDLIDPVNLIPPAAGAGMWMNVNLEAFADSLTNFSGKFYVGVVQKNNNGVYLGMDNSEPGTDATWGLFGEGSNTPGWERLRNLATFQVVDGDTIYQEMRGFNMMFRVKMSVDIKAVPPAAPQNLKIVNNDSGLVELSWARNTERDMSYYNVYRSVISELQVDPQLLISAVNQPLAAFRDETVRPGLVYYYRVTAVDTDTMESKPSNLATASALLTGEKPLDDSTLALFHFNEGRGNLVFDESNSDYNGALYKAAWDTAGRYGKSLYFDGRFGSVQIASIPLGGSGESFTVDFWFKPGNDFANEDRVFVTQGYKRFNPGKWYIRYSSSERKIIAGVESVEGIEKILSTGSGFELFGWHHVAFVRDAGANLLSLYINNNMVAQDYFDGSLSIENSYPTLMGKDARIIDYVKLSNFTGWMDELRFSNAARYRFDVITDVGTAPGGPPLPHEFALHQNYPNPFNPETSIDFDLPEAGRVVLEIFNILGQPVKSFRMDIPEGGRYSFVWNATNDSGMPVASGVYIYRIEAGIRSAVRKMVVLR